MDIRTLAVKETTVLHLRGADNELLYNDAAKKQPVTVTLYSPGTKPYAKAQAAQQNRTMEKLKKKGKSDQTADEKIEETALFLATCTHSMENIEYDKLEGAALFKAVYGDRTIGFIADQVNTHLGDWANFTGAAQTN